MLVGGVLVGAMVVVVLEVFLEQLPELSLVPDDGGVEEFVTERAHPSFSERVGLR